MLAAPEAFKKTLGFYVYYLTQCFYLVFFQNFGKTMMNKAIISQKTTLLSLTIIRLVCSEGARAN